MRRRTRKIVQHRPKRLRCSVCGQAAWGRQWWNQDTGYGVCARCGDEWPAASKGELGDVERTFGTRGIYWDVDRTMEE